MRHRENLLRVPEVLISVQKECKVKRKDWNPGREFKGTQDLTRIVFEQLD